MILAINKNEKIFAFILFNFQLSKKILDKMLCYGYFSSIVAKLRIHQILSIVVFLINRNISPHPIPQLHIKFV